MPRPPRIQFEGAFYHVFSRGNRKERIFRTEKDYFIFEKILLETTQRSEISLFNWGEMPNHFHLNIRTPAGNLAEFMQRLLTQFSKYFNRVHNLVGHVFQGRYGSRIVDEQQYFQELVRYVELNPYRTKSGKLAEFGQWKWSSWRYYRLPASQWPEACRRSFREVLSHFGSDPAHARTNMAKFISDGLRQGNWEDFYNVKDDRFIGDEAFIERVKQQNNESTRIFGERGLPTGNIETLMSVVQDISGFSSDELTSAKQTRTLSKWRKALAWVAGRLYRISLTEIGRRLRRDSTTISHMLDTNACQVEIDKLQEYLLNPRINR